ncbi:MAG: hypothetical protein MUF05_06280 [Candidatus Omnitrophica bacterium]|jgi:glucose-6-phosphate isomerase|nr:hypothetical protein [Candidatus Omnitrophota bacterium]
MENIKFDFNNMFEINVGEHGVGLGDIEELKEACQQAVRHLDKVFLNPQDKLNLSLAWIDLPCQSAEIIAKTKKLAAEINKKYENVIFLGIGGSYLGLKAASDALTSAYYNDFSSLRKKKPRVYFEGNNLDPQTLSVLLKSLKAKKTFVVVISKSGETTETKAAFSVVQAWLKKNAGPKYLRQIVAITDPSSGALRKKADMANQKDPDSFRSLDLLKGVGGRFSEFNMGLLHLAVCGINMEEVLSGARDMFKRCQNKQVLQNPAYMYALLHYILYKKKDKFIAIMMPFAETLKSTADWYSQLLGESLGKKYARKIIVNNDGTENWQMDKDKLVNVGRTPVSCRGTNDLHSIQQNNIEGRNDKAVTFIKIERFKNDIKLPVNKDILDGKSYGSLLSLAQEATQWALVREKRPNCTVILPEITPYYWGALLAFFQISIAFEAELLGINAFDQPGVEGYKNYMYFKLDKPGLCEAVKEQIRNNPLVKKPEFIL